MSTPPCPAPPPPRIAVIVPAYGVAHLVGHALRSVQAQTLADWECVVIDDGAPDDVAAAVAPFLRDTRIRFLATDNRGVSAARNRAIAETTARYLALLDGDDLLRPDYLARMVEALDADPAARLVTCNARLFGAIPRPREIASAMQRIGGDITGTLGEVLERKFNVYIGSSFRRTDYERVGGFDESMTHAEDFDFWVRLMELGGHARYLDAVLGEYRVRPSSASASGEKIIRGNIRVYEKALEALAGKPEADLAQAMIVRNADALAFEWAVDRVLAGDTGGGLAALRNAPAIQGAIGWSAALALWSFVPPLARPMLRWRRNAHQRGAGIGEVAAIGPTPGEAVRA